VVKQEGGDGGKSPKKVSGEPTRKPKSKAQAEPLFQLDGFEDEDAGKGDDDHEEDEWLEEEEGSAELTEPEEPAPSRNAIYGSSVPVSIPGRSFQGMTMGQLEEMGDDEEEKVRNCVCLFVCFVFSSSVPHPPFDFVECAL